MMTTPGAPCLTSRASRGRRAAYRDRQSLRALILGRVSVEEARAAHHRRGMLIDHRHIDPDVPDAEQVLPAQRRMVVQAMIEPAVEFALHRMALNVLRDVVIDA